MEKNTPTFHQGRWGQLRWLRALYRRVYEDHAPLMCFLSELQFPLPPILRLTTEFVLATAVRRALADQGTELDAVRSMQRRKELEEECEKEVAELAALGGAK